MKKAYVVYGNHGRSPVQLEDYHAYLTQFIRRQGYEVLFSEDPMPGQLNVLIEFFDAEFVRKIRKASGHSGGRFIVIATEFITGETFNEFGHDPEKFRIESSRFSCLARSIGGFIAPRIFPAFARRLALRAFPDAYVRIRAEYRRRFRTAIESTYSQDEYWLERYRNFCRAVPFCEQIWCVSPHQIGAYRDRFRDSKIRLMPLASWNIECSNLLQGQICKDIDFLFTGSITPYRDSVLRELKSRGFTVVEGPPTWPAYLRDHYIARSKICLQIRQSPAWKYPSIMRYHHLLSSGALVVADKGVETCMQEAFLVTAAAEDFVETCVRTIQQPDFMKSGLENSRRYFFESADARKSLECLLLPPEHPEH